MKLTANIWKESQQKNKKKTKLWLFPGPGPGQDPDLDPVQTTANSQIMMAIIFLTQKIFAEIFLRTCRGQKILRFLFLFIHPSIHSKQTAALHSWTLLEVFSHWGVFPEHCRFLLLQRINWFLFDCAKAL